MKYLGQERKRRRLNEDAIPSKFTGVPAYLSKQRPKKRSVSALSSERQRNEAVKAEEAGKAFLDTDKITTFEDIILNSPELPSSWKIISWQSEEKLVLEEIIFDEEGRPKLGYSLTIFESLGFNLVKGETIVPSSNVKHICKLEKIERFSDVSNILAYLRSNLSPEDNQTHQLKMCISKLSKIIEAENQESDNCKKLLFLRDQLALINKTPKRYSSSFIWQALTWLKHPHRCIPCSKMMAFWHCQALVT